MKRELQVGDRVRVYGFFLNGGFNAQKGEITARSGAGFRVCMGPGVEISAHPKQCRLLVPKKPCPPQGEWEKAFEEHCERGSLFHSDIERDAFLAGFQARSPLVELLKQSREFAKEAKESLESDDVVDAHFSLQEMIANITKALGEAK